MFEIPRPYSLHLGKIAVPMAEGRSSRRVLHIAMALADVFGSEISAVTVRDQAKDIMWTNKINVVTNAYKEGLARNIKIIPKIITSSDVKSALINEINRHSYDLVIIASEKRSIITRITSGPVSNQVIKKAESPTALVSVKTQNFPYKSIYIPLSETINTRSAVAFGLTLKKVMGAKAVLADLRAFDSNPTHRFSYIFDYMNEIVSNFGDNVTVIKGGTKYDLKESVLNGAASTGADAVVLGVKAGENGKIRVNSIIKDLMKTGDFDSILFKK
ncbi:TVG0489921 [Thermoplasma volcanium GSS1]|uniref:TVG0489921 protein n=1 Tax=Thermoplasma volcanium (strain ATCC 51530 / DSM 4299 / JCM 9571 / NBRC 15438 / GSS1) TaxID=273116 RepID=Q97BF4_THEVO|nr:universal stress protein [Thermoplasma volcanium]BAB59644.1 TVG0489921 [Thermoplasma volcanium GSS1]